MSNFTFVLKDKGFMNQGWWLKISSLAELEGTRTKKRTNRI